MSPWFRLRLLPAACAPALAASELPAAPTATACLTTEPILLELLIVAAFHGATRAVGTPALCATRRAAL